MVKTGIHFLFIIGCTLGAIFIEDDVWKGVFIGGSFTSCLVLIESGVEHRKYLLLLLLSKTYFRKKLIRFSISYLYRIKVDDKYLLVKGKRINQFQPVGGVYKRHPESKNQLKKMGVLDDDSIPIDGASRDDLRVRVPGKNAVPLIKWFDSKEGREVSRFREFCEELIATGILSKDNFRYIDYNLIETVENGIRFSDHFQCYEYLIADIVELRPTVEQLEELRKLIAVQNPDYIWVDDQSIRRRGYNLSAGIDVTISPTSEWIL